MKVQHMFHVALLVTALAGAVTVRAQASQFPAPVEAWRTLIEQASAGSGIPIEFLLQWVQIESFGNPCSVGIPGVEAGLAQTYHPDDDIYGATYEQLRAGCAGDSQELARALTAAEKQRQVDVLVKFVQGLRDKARQQLARGEATWSETSPDFWKLVKLYHALPALGGYLSAYRDEVGRCAETWAEFRNWLEGLSDARVTAINSAVAPWSSLSKRRWLLDNAEKAGSAVVPPPPADAGNP